MEQLINGREVFWVFFFSEQMTVEKRRGDRLGGLILSTQTGGLRQLMGSFKKVCRDDVTQHYGNGQWR